MSYGPSDCYRSSCLKCLRTLTKEHDVLPASFFCHDVSKVDQNPISGGGFAVITLSMCNDMHLPGLQGYLERHVAA